jgi:DNA-directed RNA polymerase specialized sigma subunit
MNEFWFKSAKPHIFKYGERSFVTLTWGKHSMPNDKEVAEALLTNIEEYQSVLVETYGAKIDENNQHYFDDQDKAAEALKWMEGLWMIRRLSGLSDKT